MSESKFEPETKIAADPLSTLSPSEPCYVVHRTYENPYCTYGLQTPEEKPAAVHFHATEAFPNNAAANKRCLNLAGQFAGHYSNAEIRYQQGWKGLGRCVVETREYVMSRSAAIELGIRMNGGRGKALFEVVKLTVQQYRDEEY